MSYICNSDIGVGLSLVTS